MIDFYTKPHCPYCHRARALLERKAIAFTEHDVSSAEDRQWIIEKTGHKTVPVILVGDRLIGGCDDLFRLEQSGELDALLTEAAQS